MDFTFGVLAFNSEKYIVETLNSIKYLVCLYGRKLQVQLIISDDASSDNTCKYIRQWVDKYRYLFFRIDTIFSEKNKGTVKSYQNIIELCLSNRFSVIAGDDIYSDCNIFALFDRFKENECISSCPFSLQNGKLFLENHRLTRNIYLEKKGRINSSWLLKKEMLGSYIHTPSTLFYLSNYDKITRKFVSQFKLFEDDPRWYMFLKKGTRFKFILEPFIIYRYHDSSVSHAKDRRNVLSDFEKDIIKLYNIYISDENSNFILKMYHKSKINQIKNRNKISFCLFIKELDYIDKLIFNLVHRYEKIERNRLEIALMNQKNYYQKIVKESQEDIRIFNS